MQYRDLDVFVEGPADPGKRPADAYRIELRSQGLSARGAFDLPFTDTEIENIVLKLGQSRRVVRGSSSPQAAAARDFGAKLFAELFQDEVYARLRSTLDQARRAGDGVRIRLHLHDVPNLAGMPWEYLVDPSDKHFIALSAATPIVRFVEVSQPVPPLETTLPLRILGVISQPQGEQALNVEAERRNLEQAVATLAERGQPGVLEVEWLPRATVAALQSALQRSHFHIFHFVGHGAFDPTANEGLLVFEDEQGRGRFVSASVLGTLLADHPSLRLAVLNACEGARTGRDDPFAGVAPSLLRSGVPAAVAMQFSVSDTAAISFAGSFYGALANGLTVDAAVAEARKSIFADSDVEWGTPVLFSSVEDGVIFQLPAQKPVEVKPDVLYQQVIAHARATRWPEAWTAWQALRRQFPAYPDDTGVGELAGRQVEAAKRYAQMSGLVAAHQWQKALDQWRQIVALDPAFADPENLKTRAEDGLRVEQVAAQQQQEVERLYMQMGGLISLRHWDQARDTWRKIQKLDPHFMDREAYLAQIPAPSSRPRSGLGCGAVAALVAVLGVMIVAAVVIGMNQINKGASSPGSFAAGNPAGVQAASAGQGIQAPGVAATEVAPIAAALSVTSGPAERAAAAVAPSPTPGLANEDITGYSPGRVGSWWTYFAVVNGQQQLVFRVDVTDQKTWNGYTIVESVATLGNTPFVTSYDAWMDGMLTHHSESGTAAQYVYTPPRVDLKAPLVTGATWQWDGAIVAGGPVVAHQSYSVVGRETLQTRAGTFDTVHVHSTGYEPDLGQFIGDVWYARGVGIVQSIQTGSNSGSFGYTLNGYHIAP